MTAASKGPLILNEARDSGAGRFGNVQYADGSKDTKVRVQIDGEVDISEHTVKPMRTEERMLVDTKEDSDGEEQH